VGVNCEHLYWATNWCGNDWYHSTPTLSSKLLSQMAKALDDDDYVLIASLDLCSAFDLVRVDLLIKRLKIVGHPNDIIELIKGWLPNITFYVSIDGKN
jgi:hypothetical protein